jgi:hypothetical protein
VRKTFLALLLAAVGIWAYVVAQFLSGYFVVGGETRSATRDVRLPGLTVAAQLRTPPLDSTFRDPFQSYLYAKKPTPLSETKTASSPKPALIVIEPPKATLGGILWGDSPVAILKQDGQTELVKTGAEAFGLKVQKIDRHQVTVIKQGRKFVLEY